MTPKQRREIHSILKARGQASLAKAFAQQTRVEASPPKNSFAYFLQQAEVSFLEAVKPKIEKIVGSKAKVMVKNGVSVAWLEIKGVDRSDLDFESKFHVTSIGSPDVTLFWDYDSVFSGKTSGKQKYKSGMLTPDEVATTFKQFWGA